MDCNKKNNKPTIRRSQTVTTFGVGAIIDLPETSAMICGIDQWNTKGFVPIHDERLEEKLRVSHFYMIANIDQSNEGILAVRFPRYLRCRGGCKRLSKIEVWRDRAMKCSLHKDFDEQPYCDIDGINLIPSRFVVACRKGHIDDFPFEKWVHGEETDCASPNMKYNEASGSAGLAGINISCESCKRYRNMGGSFSKKALAKIANCSGAKPWQSTWGSECGEELSTLQRGSSNIHFPIIKSSILIPPYSSDGIRMKICKTDKWEFFQSQDGAMPVDAFIKPISLEINEDIETVKDEISKMLNPDQGSIDITEDNYRYQEFIAFNNGTVDETNKKDFLIEKVSGDNYNIPLLDSVTLVKRLREVRVQTGFSRISPSIGVDESGQVESQDLRVEAVPVSERRRGWLPGYEVRGEGIFLNLNICAINNWEKEVCCSNRQKLIKNRSTRNPDIFGVVNELTPGFLAVHTLSHLLIRQLSFECGYATSSLRERIYYSDDVKHPMAGLLIYTADGGSEGTLGGLVRQGKPDFLDDIIKKAVNQSQWCSSDPLCIESCGQGFLGLNLAACHACTLLPETSCELMNRYLDRGAVIGTLDGESGLFGNNF